MHDLTPELDEIVGEIEQDDALEDEICFVERTHVIGRHNE